MQPPKYLKHKFRRFRIRRKTCDELVTRPLSCDGVDTWGSYSLTLIDALDTLAIMGNYTEFQRLLKFPFKEKNWQMTKSATALCRFT